MQREVGGSPVREWEGRSEGPLRYKSLSIGTTCGDQIVKSLVPQIIPSVQVEKILQTKKARPGESECCMIPALWHLFPSTHFESTAGNQTFPFLSNTDLQVS